MKLEFSGRGAPLIIRDSLHEAVNVIREVVQPNQDNCPKFSVLAEEWLRSRQNRVAEDTLRTYREFISALTPHFGPLCCSKINIEEVRKYQANRRKKVGAERINHEIGVLKQIMGKKRWAPIAEEYERLPQKPSEIGRALSRKEHERLFAAALAEPKWRLVYLAAVVAANTTAARRELLSLRLKDIDLDRRMIYVNKGKNRHRQRDITLNRQAFLAAQELLKRAKELGSVEPGHYLFPFFDRHVNDYDPRRHSPNFRDPWRALTRSVGLRGLRVHDLRHTAITNLLEKGVPEAVVMELAGHVERRTMLRYSHQRVSAKRKAVSSLEPRPPKKPAHKSGHRDVEKPPTTYQIKGLI